MILEILIYINTKIVRGYANIRKLHAKYNYVTTYVGWGREFGRKKSTKNISNNANKAWWILKILIAV